jgi:ribose/xylose/arabinose/galactoside ABC-type transport system permease subunit
LARASEEQKTVTGAAPGRPLPLRGQLLRAALLALVAVPFAAAYSADFPLCPSAGLLGIPCPGCGLTRATLAVFQGHFVEALRLHPLVFVLSPIYTGAMLAALLDFVRGPRSARKPPSKSWTSGRAFAISAIVLLVLTLGVWAARFLGAFGGPVPVRSYSAWHSSH